MPEYMLSVHHAAGESFEDVDLEARQPVFEAVDRFNQRLQDEGAWVFAGGLMPVDTTTTVDGRGSEPVITDGPSTESAEWLGGFWVIRAPDLEAALRWAVEGSRACAGRVQVRPFQDE